MDTALIPAVQDAPLKSQKLTSLTRQLGDQFGCNATSRSCQRATARHQRYRLQRCRRSRCTRPLPGCRPEKTRLDRHVPGAMGLANSHEAAEKHECPTASRLARKSMGAVPAIGKAVQTLFIVRNLAGVFPDALCDGEILSNLIMQLGNEVKKARFILAVDPIVG